MNIIHFGGLYAKNTNRDKQDLKYNSKEYDSTHGLNMYDYSARYCDSANGRFTTMDPLSEKYYSISPYAYVANNPMKFIDPDGKMLSTDVERNGDASYTVVGDKLDGDRNVYVTENGIRTGEIIGKTILETSFYYSENNQWLGNINLTDMSAINFLEKTSKEDPSLISYMRNATGGKKYDFKATNGTDKHLYKKSNEHYRGMPFSISKKGGVELTSARDVGNLLAGYIAGKKGLAWKTARFGFDLLESSQQGELSTEGLSTRNAERFGHNIGAKLYKPNS